jgi:5'-3' exonuclease
MGIKNLHTFLRKTCPHVYEEVHLSEYAYKKVGVDTAIYLCKFKTSMGGQWLNGFLQICMIMRLYGIHPVFLFDNVFPAEKDEEKKRRSDARKQQRAKMQELREEWDRYRETLTARSLMYCRMKDPTIPITLYSFLFKTFISSNSLEEDHDHRISIVDIDHEFIRIENTMLQVDPLDYQKIRDLLDVLKVPHILAAGEAEAMGSYLCREGKLDAVLTDDTDVLAYGCPVFLHKLDLYEHRCVRLVMTRVLEALEMSQESFLDFCILCGTDYNVNLPGIGHERAYKLLKKHSGSINEIVAQNNTVQGLLTTSSFPFERVREMFAHQPQLCLEINLPWCDFPDWNQVTSFLFYHNCNGVPLEELHKNLYENASVVFPIENNTITPSTTSTLGVPLLKKRPCLLRPACLLEKGS